MNASFLIWFGDRRWFAAGLALLVVIAPDVHAKIYKWVDADGKIQYSQTPPPAGEFNEVKPGPPSSQPSGEADRQLQDLLQRQEESEKQDEADKMEKQEKASSQAKLDQVCDKARQELTVLENSPGPRLGVMDNGVVVRRMTEDERQAKITQIRKVLSETCE